MAATPGRTDIVRGLGAVVGSDHLVTDPDVVAAAVVDWTGRVRGHSPALVRPGDADELAAVVRWCAERGVGLTVQGGNTGLSGGAVPLSGQVVVQTSRFHALGDVDVVAGQVTAGAGVPLARLQQAATDAGWSYAVDFASRDSASVGGTVATNAGGVHVLRHGATRAQLLGVEAVLGTGAVVSRLGGLVKDVSGYDLGSLLCGSEGTLGIVTRARVRLVAPEPFRTTALVAFRSARAAVDAAAVLRRLLPSLVAAELMLGDGMALVCRALRLPAPFADTPPAVLLLEVSGTDDRGDALADAVAALDARNTAVATDPSRRADLWRYRNGHSEAVSTLGVPHKIDVAVPLGAVADYLEAVPAAVRRRSPGAQVWLFGHVGDGNVHVNVTGVAPDDDIVDDAVVDVALELGGTISAEHGVGTVKRRFMERARSAAELDAFRSLKRALDPAGVLNPGVLLPD